MRNCKMSNSFRFKGLKNILNTLRKPFLFIHTYQAEINGPFKEESITTWAVTINSNA